MNLEVAAHPHGYARTRVDPVKAGLGRAPDTEPGGEIAIDRPRHPRAAIDEQVAALETDDAALKIRIEAEAPWQRPVVQATFEEDCKGVAAATAAADHLPALGGDPHRNAGEGVDPDPARDLAA